MPDTENKVQFGLEKVHYAVLEGGAYGTPVPIPGAVNLSLNPVGEMEKFYADNVVYYVSNTNDGYDGDLEVAKFPMQMLQEVWGFVLSQKDKVLTEMADAVSVTFALLFQIRGDATRSNFVMYACTGTRPGLEGKTMEEGKRTPTTQKSSITAVPLEDGKVFARTTKDTPKEVMDNWFKQVYTGETAPAAESGAVS